MGLRRWILGKKYEELCAKLGRLDLLVTDYQRAIKMMSSEYAAYAKHRRDIQDLQTQMVTMSIRTNQFDGDIGRFFHKWMETEYRLDQLWERVYRSHKKQSTPNHPYPGPSEPTYGGDTNKALAEVTQCGSI